MAFIDEPVIIRGEDLGNEFLTRLVASWRGAANGALCDKNSTSFTHGYGTLRGCRINVNAVTAIHHPVVYPLYVLFELVFAFELFAAAVAHKLSDVGVPQHV